MNKKNLTLSSLALFAFSTSAFAQGSSCLSVRYRFETAGGIAMGVDDVVTHGVPLTADQECAVQGIIDFVKATQGCFPAPDPSSNPPTNAPGHMPPGEPYDPGGDLQELLDDDKICKDEGTSNLGMSSPLANDSPVGGFIYSHAPGLNINADVVNSDGFNIGTGLPAKFNPGSGPPAATLSFGGGVYSPTSFIAGVETLMHELQHTNEGINSPVSGNIENLEAPVWASMAKMWCELLECAAGSSPDMTQEAKDTINDAKDEICSRIEAINGELDDMDSPQVECELCDNEEAESNDGTEGDGHPGAGGEDGQSYCGWNTLYRRSDYHTQTSYTDGFGSILARISYANRSVRVNYFRGGAQSASFDVTSSQISLPPGSGDFLPISVEAIASNSIVVGGYAELTGEGVFVKLNFAASTILIGSGGVPQAPTTSSTSQILFQDCSVTYPVAMGYRRGDGYLYFIDRDLGSLMALNLNAGTVYTIASYTDHPELEDALTLQVDTWRDDFGTPGVPPALMGPKVEVSDKWLKGQGIYASDRIHLTFADTDNNGRFDLFQQH